MKTPCFLLTTLLLSASIHAQEASGSAPELAAQRTRIGVFAHGDSLDHGYDNWSGVRVELGNEARGHTGGHIALFSEHRFGGNDQGIELGASIPMGKGWLWVPQVSLAPSADFLARGTADLDVFKELGNGWVISAGVGHSRYRDASVNRVEAGVERYIGAWRIGYQASASHLLGRNGVAHDLRFARAYADSSEVGLQFNAGREPVMLAQGIVNSEVKGVGVFGRHGLGQDWTLWWNAGVTRQGDFYTRRSVGLGLQYQY